MNTKPFELEHAVDNAWCPACGNFGILSALKMVLTELELDPKKVVISSGIGQAAKSPQYMKVNYFNGLHGRTIPVAVAVKAVNPELIVIAQSGDGDTYGEGGNHFMHGIRRNSDITNIVHNNMIYGLTKGQASPTSQIGMKTKLQTNGVFVEPFNPIAVAISLGASFVARANIGDLIQTKDIFKQAITHRGYALVDVFQPCVVFNKLNTYKWFKENTYYLDESHDATNRVEAFQKSLEDKKFPLGVIYKNPEREAIIEGSGIYARSKAPLYLRKHENEKLKKALFAFSR